MSGIPHDPPTCHVCSPASWRKAIDDAVRLHDEAQARFARRRPDWPALALWCGALLLMIAVARLGLWMVAP